MHAAHAHVGGANHYTPHASYVAVWDAAWSWEFRVLAWLAVFTGMKPVSHGACSCRRHAIGKHHGDAAPSASGVYGATTPSARGTGGIQGAQALLDGPSTAAVAPTAPWEIVDVPPRAWRGRCAAAADWSYFVLCLVAITGNITRNAYIITTLPVSQYMVPVYCTCAAS